MAAALNVSRSTVTAALDELRADGTVESRQGSGTVVRDVHAHTIAGTRIAEHFFEVGGIDLAAGNPPDASHLPPIHLDVAALLAKGGGPGVQPLGLPALRAVLADRHAEHGRLTDPSQIHVTAGAHQAVSLSVRSLVRPGMPVAVEDVSYPGIFDIIDAIGARAVPVRTDHAGLIPTDLDRVLAEHHPPVLYVQTGPHNPTGRVPTPGRLQALAEVLDRHDTTVIEDGALAELAFAGRVRPELADLCRRAVVVSVGSFSKVAWGGLRIGWLRAPAPFVERTMYLRLANDLGAVGARPAHRPPAGPPSRRPGRPPPGHPGRHRRAPRSTACRPTSPSGRSRRPAGARCCGPSFPWPTPAPTSCSPAATASTWRRAASPPPPGRRTPTCASASTAPGRRWRRASTACAWPGGSSTPPRGPSSAERAGGFAPAAMSCRHRRRRTCMPGCHMTAERLVKPDTG